jgi:CDGSH-type Zn-finger protein
VTITAYKDGPYIVRGAVDLRDELGLPIAAQRPAIALCRCGKSRNRPYCDGTHRIIGFRAAGSSAPGDEQVAA